MSENRTKFRFKINELEIECEGQEQFIKNELPNICNQFKDVDFGLAPKSVLPKELDAKLSDSKPIVSHSVSSIASIMKVKSGPELVMAASAYLTFSQGKESFSRQEIHEEMKRAKGHYKKGMSSNLVSNIASLVKNRRLNEGADGSYALAADEKSELTNLIA